MARSKSELRQEIQKRINAIAKSQYSTSIISKIVIVGACRSPDFDSQDCSLGSNLENQIIERSIFFAERFFNDYNLNFHGSDLGEVHSTIILLFHYTFFILLFLSRYIVHSFFVLFL